MTFHDPHLNSMTFRAWKIELRNSMTFQVLHYISNIIKFHDFPGFALHLQHYKIPWLSRVCTTSPTTDWHINVLYFSFFFLCISNFFFVLCVCMIGNRVPFYFYSVTLLPIFFLLGPATQLD